MNTRVLRAKCIEKGITLDELATRLKLSKSTMYRRMKCNSLTVKNVDDIAGILSLTQADVISIFFEANVA